MLLGLRLIRIDLDGYVSRVGVGVVLGSYLLQPTTSGNDAAGQ